MSSFLPEPLDRRELLGVFGGALLGAAAGCGPQAKGTRPNILFLMADQLRWDALAVNGNRIVATPNLDRLAAGAVNFRQAICPAPLCGPSRAGMLTGTLIRRHGCRANGDIESAESIAALVPTFDELLAAAGYRCEYHGKWHTGSAHQSSYAVPPCDYLELYRGEMLAKHGLPADAGQGEWETDFYTHLPYRPLAPDRTLRKARAERGAQAHRPECGESYLPAEDSLSAWTAKRVIAALRAVAASPVESRAPFCITGSILAPHSPLIATRPYSTLVDPASIPLPANLADEFELRDRLRMIPDPLPATAAGLGQVAAIYHGLVSELDHWIGAILDALDELGLSANTLVVFTSDHGEMLGSHGMLAKMNFFEEALRVPLLVRAPGMERGATSDVCVTGRDLFATLLDFAGVALPEGPLASTSLRPLLAPGGTSVHPASAVSELSPSSGTYPAIRSLGWKLMPLAGRWYLFDLARDPGERHNALGDGDAALTRAKELHAELVAYLAAHGDAEGAAALPAVG